LSGPVTGFPPPLADDTKKELLAAAESDATGQTAPSGKDAEEGKKVKSEKELAKERAKAEKMKKFAEKQAKNAEAQKAPKDTKEAKKKPEKKEEAPLPTYVEETPPGAKKILKSLDEPFNKAYVPQVVESAWMEWWKKEGFFEPKFQENGEVSEDGYFVIPIPPPNVTGALHCGHALATALQDVLCRYNRMLGKTVLYLPVRCAIIGCGLY
jgi:valyl-tRNA synthetase